jgi:hypothetical protein
MHGLNGLNRSRQPMKESFVHAADRRTQPQDSSREPRCSELDRSDEPRKRRNFPASEVYLWMIAMVTCDLPARLRLFLLFCQ